MSVNGITGSYGAYGYEVKQADSKEKETESTKEQETTKNDAALESASYEKSADTTKSASYSINKMSADDRAALVKQLKADQESRQQNLVDIVQKMMGKQANAYGIASGDDSMWKFLAGGNFTVDAATKAQAQRDIAEDGYWGVEQTSQRLFDFASALAGDDVEQMQKMQAAMEKGFKLATGSWGKKLPSICQDTLDAANQKFEDYYASKKAATVEE